MNKTPTSTKDFPGTAANRHGNLADFAAKCAPTDWEARNTIANDRRVYIQQLEKIECPSEKITEAVIAYQKSFINRTEWLKRKLVNRGDLEQYEERLTKQHESVFERKRDPEDSDEEHGRGTYNLCRGLASNAQIDNRQPNGCFWDGALHTLSDNAVIGWHPEWKDQFKKDTAK